MERSVIRAAVPPEETRNQIEETLIPDYGTAKKRSLHPGFAYRNKEKAAPDGPWGVGGGEGPIWSPLVRKYVCWTGK
jgi:hypothetical protein